MVVLQHDQLHNVLWGPASRDGRTKRSDIIVYVQLALVAALGIWQFYEYDKPVAARLAACGATLLLYFRSVSLFIRLIILISMLIAFGDIFVPAKRLLTSGDPFSVHNVPLLIYAQFIYNNGKIVCLVARAMPASSKKKPIASRPAVARKPKAA